MIGLGLKTDDAAVIAHPDTRKFRAFVMAHVANFQKQIAPVAILFSFQSLEQAFDKSPSYVADGWRKMIAAVQDFRRDLARWEQDEKDLDGQK